MKPKAKTVARLILFVTFPIWMIPGLFIKLTRSAWREFNELMDEKS
jgi:hypothetical protein